MGAIVLLVGVIGLGVVIAAVTAFALTRGRRNSANGVPNSWQYPQQTVYPPQQTMPPAAQPPYPTSAPNQPYGYQTPPVQPAQNQNPYTHQPPYGQ